jgi:hypothetical protein
MNELTERLVEIAEQAGFFTFGDSAYVKDEQGSIHLVDPELIKYTELIIEECVDIAKHHIMNITTYDDANFVEEQIRKHFGVEE